MFKRKENAKNKLINFSFIIYAIYVEIKFNVKMRSRKKLIKYEKFPTII